MQPKAKVCVMADKNKHGSQRTQIYIYIYITVAQKRRSESRAKRLLSETALFVECVHEEFAMKISSHNAILKRLLLDSLYMPERG